MGGWKGSEGRDRCQVPLQRMEPLPSPWAETWSMGHLLAVGCSCYYSCQNVSLQKDTDGTEIDRRPVHGGFVSQAKELLDFRGDRSYLVGFNQGRGMI